MSWVILWIVFLVGFLFGVLATLFVMSWRRIARLSRSGRHAEEMARHLRTVGHRGEGESKIYGSQ